VVTPAGNPAPPTTTNFIIQEVAMKIYDIRRGTVTYKDINNVARNWTF
jgi:hypothetical protein